MNKVIDKPKIKKSRLTWAIVYLLLVILVSTEIILRSFFGFGETVLYRYDSDFEYIAIPQKTKRFGNHVSYNSFSQRNEEITSKDSIIILGFGDSVINGGSLVDDDSLATTKLSKYLTKLYKKHIKVLNISSQSWGPDNCYAHLKKYGDFKAKAMFLVLSSHDAFDNMDFENIVGVNKNYPAKQYYFAIDELVEKYLIPKIINLNTKVAVNNGNEIDKRKKGSVFNTGIYNLSRYAKVHNLPFVIYLHADKDELKRHTYSSEGRLIESFCAKHNVTLIKELDFKLLDDKAYRDGIHLNSLGQSDMFEILKDKIYHVPPSRLVYTLKQDVK